ncbi:hypothetical protein CFK37_08540 [Virgibacillus phasianinus]|uniref:FIMAH domain-containing protein n=1 Tax=Virgibacillus phasianinus TaxID=2017483 RepID=A0A220U1U2_9BACI|nr:DUF1349 domain-containing protein [Virgibacillus phasianinus]ASK62204.1 hypothetical protein CFK37_08540 [Virgibacillus phasianinus]
MNTPSGIIAEALTDVTTDSVAPGETFAAEWKISALDESGSNLLANLDIAGTYRINKTDAQTSNNIRLLIEKDIQPPFKTKSFNDAIFSQSGEQFAIYGGGNDLWGLTNEYGTIYQKDAFSSGRSVITKVMSQDHTGPWARAGIVARNDLTKQNGSAGYINLAITPENGCVLSRDSNGDGYLDSYKNVKTFTTPVYLRLTREGHTFTGECSTDGENWTMVGKVDVSGAAEVEDVGLFMTAANGATDNKGIVQFEGFSINPTEEISITDLKKQVKQFRQDGEIVNDKAAYALTLHVTAVEHYVNNKENDKVVKHLKGFKQLLGYQEENNLISEKAYKSIKFATNYLLDKWK